MESHLLNAIHSSLHINQLRQVHALVTTKYQSLNFHFIRRLLNLSFTGYARRLFDQMPRQNQRLHNVFIAAYSRLCLNTEAIDMFVMMHRKNSLIGSFTIPPVVKSCSALLVIELGKQIHSLAIHYGFGSNLFVQTAFMDFYAKSGDLDSARIVFDGISVKDPISYNCLISAYSKTGDVSAARRLFDGMTERTVVSWNSMISCYAHNGDHHEAILMFERMQVEKYCPNEFTLVILLSICAKLGDLEMGLKVKKFIDDTNAFPNMIVATALMEMFVKCGAVDEARQEFDRMNKRDIVTWGAMIAGYAQNGRPSDALELFECMKHEQIRPNDVTIASVLTACAQLGSAEAGERIGSYIESEGFNSNVYVASALLSMYSRCGNIKKAQQVFDKMLEKDIVSWNSMITGLAFNGYAIDAINLFEQMKETEVKPNDITFVALLTACTHVGLIDLGLEFFDRMLSVHDIVPKVEHYACIVDLFCRCGKLNEAFDFILEMKVEPNVVIWGTLLSACRIHSNVELAEIAVKKLQVLEPENSGNYVLLSNLYANSGRWQDALRVRSLMRDEKVQKTAAYSWIELEDGVHKFLVSDSSHSKSDEICIIVEGLSMQSVSDESDIYVEFCL
ncbi:hypothetical protein Nepgr_021882 [Nepenthes gracilis]|uniref:Pentatricopeptide repeat-containing protein n=1 Tax=Nepenthes gracilis TaxID=150966 RepID=A0AAD3XXU1_NEPGR|nr:hypothetical protein Nepgr_021882 [Nepenthes gracilis]